MLSSTITFKYNFKISTTQPKTKLSNFVSPASRNPQQILLIETSNSSNRLVNSGN